MNPESSTEKEQEVKIPKENLVKLDTEKVFYSATELLTMTIEDTDYLMEPIFPRIGTAVLVGRPDCGKSQFARQLCIQVALKDSTFLDFKLSARYQRSIYVTTEDGLDATRSAVKKQFNGLSLTENDNVQFLVADTMEQKRIVKLLNKELKRNPADLVVVDSFGDIFTGGDSNNNMAMRNTVKIFDKVAKEHGSLILFVHHINKSGYKQSPSQEHIQGGGGLTQKVRLAIQLSDAPGNKRYLSVVKGNYCPKKFKENSTVLGFDEETLLFENTGMMIKTSAIGAPKDDRQVKRKSELQEAAESIFSDSAITYGEFVTKYQSYSGKKVATAKRVHKEMLDLELITKEGDKYSLNVEEDLEIDE